jgi:hypothetical protein
MGNASACRIYEIAQPSNARVTHSSAASSWFHGRQHIAPHGNVEQRNTLAHAAPRNPKEVAPVSHREPAVPFGEIRRDRERRAVELVGEKVVSPRKAPSRSTHSVRKRDAFFGRRVASQRKTPCGKLSPRCQQGVMGERERRKETEERGPLAHSPSRLPKLFVSFLLSASLLSISVRCADRNRDFM